MKEKKEKNLEEELPIKEAQRRFKAGIQLKNMNIEELQY
jgi:hypothetical protein